MYLKALNEMIDLLDKGGHEHWKKWFLLAKEYYVDGNHEKSFKKVLGAYGGMGSFNDVFWNLFNDDFERLEYLKGEIWRYSKSKL
ncbi:DUF6966 domain-containing protein [Shewanella woodyi]|uniref:DUF6966 domain-containing protein n=1 Tax=Shewanella woodyi TaxID=60961 RepID=UPI0007EBA8B7|nr:hypothetical protein [Shewanella woodyi]